MPTDTTQATVFPDPIPYCSVGYADAFLATDLEKVGIWSGLTAAQKLAALKMATRDIDQLTYVGIKQHYAQDRQFPRFFAFGTFADMFYLDNPIPEEVARACAIQAWYRAKQYVLGEETQARQDHQMQGINNVSRLGSSESSDLNRARVHNLCREAKTYLKPFIGKTGNLEREFGYHIPGAIISSNP
jgi:hypothetical protein